MPVTTVGPAPDLHLTDDVGALPCPPAGGDDVGATQAVRRPAVARTAVTRTAVTRTAVTRAAVVAAGLAVAAWLLGPQLHELPEAVAVVGGADPLWLAGAVLCALSAYAAAALALQSAIGTRLPVGRNLQVQVASTAASAVTPAGAGGLALHARFLERRGIPRAQALAAVGVGRLAAAAVHGTTLVVLAPVLTRRIGALDLHAALPLGLAAGGALALLLVGRRSERVRVRSARLLAPLADVLRSLVADPQRVAGLLGGSLLVSAFRALTFAAGLRALGVTVPLVAVAALFLAAEALGALGSTPGGLGLLDGALLTGTVALGAAPAAGLGAVLLFRLLTLWAPVVPGLVVLRSLRRARVL